jgi:hypothetical protein
LKGIVLYLSEYGNYPEAGRSDGAQGCLLFCLLLHTPLALINQTKVLVANKSLLPTFM